jgi:catechol 2,3-dioxygenase-like lactoylglutathione lyase family enzyme
MADSTDRPAEPLAEVADLDHVALSVADLEASLRFYRDLLGMEVRDRERYEAGEVPYVAVVAGGRHLHLVPTDDPVTVDGDHVCLLVRSAEVDSGDEIESLLSDLRAAGVTVEEGEPHDRYGAYGRAPAAYVRDPDGRRVELKFH